MLQNKETRFVEDINNNNRLSVVATRCFMDFTQSSDEYRMNLFICLHLDTSSSRVVSSYSGSAFRWFYERFC